MGSIGIISSPILLQTSPRAPAHPVHMIDRVDNIIPVCCVPVLRCQPFMGDLPCESHGTDCRCCRLKRMLLICSHKCCCKSRKLAAGSRDGGHHRMAIVNTITLFCVRHEINSACNRDHSPVLPKRISSRMPPPHQRLSSVTRSAISASTPFVVPVPCKRLDLRDISADHGEFLPFLRVRLPSMSGVSMPRRPPDPALPGVPAHWPAFPRSSWTRWYGCSAYRY